MIEVKDAQGGEGVTNNPVGEIRAKDLIYKKLSIEELLKLWDQGWGIAVHVSMDDESPYIITRKSDFFDIHGNVFECFFAGEDKDEKFMQIVIVE